jgi:hypothetical protein
MFLAFEPRDRIQPEFRQVDSVRRLIDPNAIGTKPHVDDRGHAIGGAVDDEQVLGTRPDGDGLDDADGCAAKYRYPAAPKFVT